MNFLNLDDVNVEGKTVIVRGGMDVSVDKEGNLLDDKRVVACMPTIQNLVTRKAKVILLLHIGRPKGKEPHLRTDNVAKRLARFMFRDIEKLDSVTGEEVKERVRKMEPGEIIFLENLRFHEGEKKNDGAFARELASLGDLYVNECFSVSHRKHASMVGIPQHIPGVAGYGLRKELEILGKCIKDPERPMVAILGGVKADKMNALKRLSEKADHILVGGGLSLLLMKMKGHEIGDSKFDDEWLNGGEDIKEILSNGKLVLPEDFVVADKFDENAETKVVPKDRIEKGWLALDIGPRTIERYKEILDKAKTIIWAGPMGVFEWKRFSKGTEEIAKFIANSEALSVVGGGESASAAEKFNVADRMTHVSTGGGAFLEFVAKETLPAVDALSESKERFQ
ncbi:MAG: phosphoglycerate kinase [Candidatus Aenigmarchaeota archaeon]|nr:phosphoglycerate kinase [Candidatus Aenigmarchaeota archaeon]